MYRVETSGALLRGHKALLARRGLVPRTVILLGLTSFLTDVSAEMVATVLPLYLVFAVGLTPLQFGLIDGLYQGSAALVRIGSGFLGDRFRRHKEVASVGYALSAVSKLALLLTAGFGAVSAAVVADRTGKGIRTAPRDALISLATPQERLGMAFGVHRALDTAGAMLGPLIAFVLLALAPGSFHTVFFVSFCFAVLGVAVIVLFVSNPTEPRTAAPAPPRERVSLRSAAGLVRVGRFRALLLTTIGLGLVTASDGFVYLALQRRMDFELRLFPLLFVGTAAVYMVLAAPIGRLADRFGRTRVFLIGYALLLAVYGILLLPSIGPAALIGCMVALGTYYAATDGVLAAAASATLPGELRGTGLAVIATGSNLSRFAASVIFGALWTIAGLETALSVFALGLALVVVFSGLMLARGARSALA